MTLQERFDFWTRMINYNPNGFSKSQTGKRRFSRGTPSVSPYEQMAAKVYNTPVEPEFSSRGAAKRLRRFIANSKVSENRPVKYRHSSAFVEPLREAA